MRLFIWLDGQVAGTLDPVGAGVLRQSLLKVAEFREAALAPLKLVLTDYATIAQQRWLSWLKKQRLESSMPIEFSRVLDLVFDFADPLIAGEFTNEAWDAAAESWT